MRNTNLLPLLFLLFMSSIWAYGLSVCMRINRQLHNGLSNPTALLSPQDTAVHMLYTTIHPCSVGSGAHDEGTLMQQVANIVATEAQASFDKHGTSFFTMPALVPLADVPSPEMMQPYLTEVKVAGGTAVFFSWPQTFAAGARSLQACKI